jgi:hypothetical protein
LEYFWQEWALHLAVVPVKKNVVFQGVLKLLKKVRLEVRLDCKD